MLTTFRTYRRHILALTTFLFAKCLVAAPPPPPCVATCTPAGSVAALITCIQNGDSCIDLGGFSYTLTVPTVPAVDGENGLPDITGQVTIFNGSIERSQNASNFRIFHIAATGTLELHQVTLDFGTIDDGGTGAANSGGAIYNLGSLSLTNSTLSNNTANDLGGAIYNAGDLEINGSNISGNTALNSSELDGGGGGIFNAAAGTISLISTTSIVGNKTPGFGGGINNHGTIDLIKDSTISNNPAQDDIVGGFPATAAGGGIYNHNNAVITLIINSTIAANSAYEGGGIYNNGTLGIKNSTISLNEANNGGGGIYNNTPGIITDLVSTIVANNLDTSLTSPDINNLGSITATERYNLIGDNSGVPTILNAQNNDIVGFDAFLGPLQDNGGLTFTMAPLPESLALNNGLNPNNLEFDQRGDPFLRVVNGRPEIGAVEVSNALADEIVICVDTDEDGICDEVDNCPGTPNANQLDTDLDSIGDVCDNCPLVANFNQYDLDEDGIGNACDPCTDSDDDGFLNPGFETVYTTCPEDNCPFIFNPDQKINPCKKEKCKEDDCHDDEPIHDVEVIEERVPVPVPVPPPPPILLPPPPHLLPAPPPLVLPAPVPLLPPVIADAPESIMPVEEAPKEETEGDITNMVEEDENLSDSETQSGCSMLSSKAQTSNNLLLLMTLLGLFGIRSRQKNPN